ncbi:MAG TPA: hypothetical protein VGF25_18125 [Thermoleophilaceae bacterium]
MHPVRWGEADAKHWWISLRCGGCGARREAVVPDAVAQEFDNQLDRALDQIEREADLLARHLMSEEADVLAAAFDRDLIDVDDFRR